MKKFLFGISGILLLFQADAMRLEDYTPELASRFLEDMRPIYGYIWLNSGLPQAMRAFGANGDETIKSPIEVMMHSINDTSINLTIDLCCRLFPSAGPTFNAKSTGSISEYVRKASRSGGHGKMAYGTYEETFKARERKFMVDLVYQMLLRSTYDPRKIPLTDITFGKDNKGREITVNKKVGKKLFPIFDRICYDISKSTKAEERTGSSSSSSANFDRLPKNFTTDMILAYAWSVLDKEQMEQLANLLNPSASSSSAASAAPQYTPFEAKVKSDFDKYIGNSRVPFYPGKKVARYGIAEYQGVKFADCSDTTLRQFFATLLCKGRGESLEADFTRIPEGKLKAFFSHSTENIRQLANDTRSEVRNEWADVESGHPRVNYCNPNKCELNSEWRNFLVAFCAIMSDYPKLSTRNEEAASCIAEINARGFEAFRDASGRFTEERFLEVLNRLLKIRTDIQLKAVSDELEIKEGSGETYGRILIRPVVSESVTAEDVKNNTLAFNVNHGHGELSPIAVDTSAEEVDFSSPWINQLYYDVKAAVIGEKYKEPEILGWSEFGWPETHPLDDAAYPLLEYFRRIGASDVQDYSRIAANSIYQLLSYSEASSEGMTEPLGLLGIKRFMCDIAFADDSSLKLIIKKSKDQIIVPGSNTFSFKGHVIFDICKYIMDHSYVTDNLVEAIKFLCNHKHLPEVQGYLEELKTKYPDPIGPVKIDLSEEGLENCYKQFLIRQYLLRQDQLANQILLEHMKRLSDDILHSFIDSIVDSTQLISLQQPDMFIRFSSEIADLVLDKLPIKRIERYDAAKDENDDRKELASDIRTYAYMLAYCDLTGVNHSKIQNFENLIRLAFEKKVFMDMISLHKENLANPTPEALKMLSSCGTFVENTEEADGIFDQWSHDYETFTPAMASALLVSVSEDRFETLLSKIQFKDPQPTPLEVEYILAHAEIYHGEKEERFIRLLEHISKFGKFKLFSKISYLQIINKERVDKILKFLDYTQENIPFWYAGDFERFMDPHQFLDLINRVYFSEDEKFYGNVASFLNRIKEDIRKEALEIIKKRYPNLNEEELIRKGLQMPKPNLANAHP